MATSLMMTLKKKFPEMPDEIAYLIAEVVDSIHWRQAECIEYIEYVGFKKIRPKVYRLYFECDECNSRITVVYSSYHKKIYEIRFEE